jgi:hypothetical protein
LAGVQRSRAEYRVAAQVDAKEHVVDISGSDRLPGFLKLGNPSLHLQVCFKPINVRQDCGVKEMSLVTVSSS